LVEAPSRLRVGLSAIAKGLDSAQVGDTGVHDGHGGVGSRPLQRQQVGQRPTDREATAHDDDVQTVWGNYEIPDAVMEKLG